jgi:hypothetical protein
MLEESISFAERGSVLADIYPKPKTVLAGKNVDQVQREAAPTDNNGSMHHFDSELPGIQLHPETVLTEENYYRIWPMKMTNLDYKFLRNSESPCAGKPVKLLVMVLTRPSDGRNRQVICSTWGAVASTGKWKERDYPGIFLYFLLGVPDRPSVELEAEMEAHNDIILANFVDTYQNLTLKSLLQLKWAMEFCSGVDFIAKVDGDMFFNIPKLWPCLDDCLADKLMGRINRGPKVHTSGKWFVPRSQFPFEFFPKYLRGGAYILGTTAIPRLVLTAEYVPPISIEDVFITGVLTQILNITIVDHECFTFHLWTP